MTTVRWFNEARSRTFTAAIVGGPDPDVGVQALRAFDVWDNLGVCCHMPEVPYTDTDAVIVALNSLGVRNVRDGASAKNPAFIAAVNRVAVEAGVGFNLGLGKPVKPRPAQWPTQVMSYWIANGMDPANIRSFESCNEQNLPTQNNLPANGYTEAQWATATWDYMTELWTTSNAVTRPPEWQAIPIMGYPYANASATVPPAAPTRIQAAASVGDWDSLCDWGNVHNYYYDNIGRDVTNPTAAVRAHQYNAPGKPLVVTETGYHNVLTVSAGHKPTPLDVSAWNIVKNPFEWFRIGIFRVFFYELLNEGVSTTDIQQNFGLFEYKAPAAAGDFAPKPAALALANLTAIFADPTGAAYAPGKLDFTISAAPNLKYELRQRASDDAFLLTAWRDVPTWTWTGVAPNYGTYPTVLDANVTVTLPRVFATVEHRRPSAVTGAGGGPTLVSTATNVSSVTIPIGRHLSVLVIK